MAIPLAAVVSALRGASLLVETTGTLPETVETITDDSRAVSAGALFIAVRGSERDGHDFLPQAERAGASAAIVEDATRTSLPAIVVRDGRRAAAIAAAAAHGWPARSLRVIGVTGTNGKTTVANMLRHVLDKPPALSASIGTLGVLIGSDGLDLSQAAPLPSSTLTTPGPVALQQIFRALVDRGVRTVAMEMSSHALDQRRAEGVVFDAAVFTNLTRDHLDYHKTMDAYLAAKARLVDQLAPHGAVVVNVDDAAWNALPDAGRRVRFGVLARDADVRAEKVEFNDRGSRWTLAIGGERHQVGLPLMGEFNVSNALAAAGAAWALGESPGAIAQRLSSLPQVPVRLERLHDHPAILRDYAHTPDALARALAALRPFTKGRLICVFGAGGERDRGKRPQMGAVAGAGADVVVVTSDNPRSEDSERIIDDVVAGITVPGYLRLADRREAIARAVEMAEPDDAILLAGKGHETYQVIGKEYVPFDEKTIVNELLRVRA